MLVVQGEVLAAQARHALERAPGVLSHREHARAIKVVAVFESDVDADHCGPTALPIASGRTRRGIPRHLRRSTSATRMPLASSRSRVLRLQRQPEANAA